MSAARTMSRPDFWLTSGFHLLRRNENGHMGVTDEFLRAYVRRPELKPVADSCAAERMLYAELLSDPLLQVAEDRLAGLADADVRENYALLLHFRDLLVRHGAIEPCYLALIRGPVSIPPLFVTQLVHIAARNMLEECDDPLRVRAAELLFRTQMVNIDEGHVMLADEDTVEMHATQGGFSTLTHLLAADKSPREVALDVLGLDTAALYWERSDRFDTVLDIGFTQPGLDAFCRVLETWVRHFLRVETRVEPLPSIKDERWSWHVGLDAESSAILNDLYKGREVEDERRRHLLALFRMEFRDAGDMLASIAGRPVYLGLAMAADSRLRVKPQNLLVNLPLAAAS